MAAGRTLRSLVSRRRRVDEDGEDEEGPVFADDSQSEGSVLTEPEDEEEVDADASSVGGLGEAQTASADPAPAAAEVATNGTSSKKARKSRKKVDKKGGGAVEVAVSAPQTEFKVMADTEAMMNGLKLAAQDGSGDGVIDFDKSEENGAAVVPRTNGDSAPAAERQRREHEEYRKKRDSNPAFIPNRGNFFMHDTRGQSSGPAPLQRNGYQNTLRARGSGNAAATFPEGNQMNWADRVAAEQPWKHDLHDTINEEPVPQPAPQPPAASRPFAAQRDSAYLFPKAAPQPSHGPPRTISFDSTTLLGTVQVRVSLPGMKAPSFFADVPVRKYVRLPNHRPPLRRDKAVRVFIPGNDVRTSFPLLDRSFIFIPRQNRPNQQGFHRGYQRSVGGYGYSSRRTSMHGSMYSASVAPSRRSSLAGNSRDRAFSPAGSFVGMPPSRPIVRLPHGSQPLSAASTPIGPLSGHHTPTGVPQLHTYPLPQAPLQMGTPTTTVHQPRPTKDVDIAKLEPFHTQLPAHMQEPPQFQPQQPPPPPQPYFSPAQQYQYPHAQPQTGTPLSGIPEQAVHAAAFHPPAYGQPQYYPPYPPQQGFIYSPPTSGSYPPMPMYMMPPPPGYMLPPPAPPLETPMSQTMASPDRPSSPRGDTQIPQSSQSGMVAHESNGMVFYVPASEAQSSERYQPAESFVPSYAMPGLAPPTPAPDNQMQYYYPPMPHSGMQEVGAGVYYPAQQ